jgi:CBS domain-containing protein
MKAGDVMTRRVVSVQADASILAAAELMLQNKISGLPVVDPEERLVGVVTERDFLRQPDGKAAHARPRWSEVVIGPTRSADVYAGSHTFKVAEVMTADPRTVAEDTPVEDIVRLMEQHQIKRVPVLREGRLVGIIARADLMRALVRVIRQRPANNDVAMSRRLIELEKRYWAHRTKPTG